jgi:Tfp pilus assembly protein PilP
LTSGSPFRGLIDNFSIWRKSLKNKMILKPAEHGEAQEQYYAPGKTEPFGLNKRTRRLRRGIACTMPDGTTDGEKLEKYGL